MRHTVHCAICTTPSYDISATVILCMLLMYQQCKRMHPRPSPASYMLTVSLIIVLF